MAMGAHSSKTSMTVLSVASVEMSTDTAPLFITPQYAITPANEFSQRKATRDPGPTPDRRSRPDGGSSLRLLLPPAAYKVDRKPNGRR